jgi:hypothetical protein
MAVGDVRYFQNLRLGTKEFRLMPGTTQLVLAKGYFNEDPPSFESSSFGAVQLYFGYGAVVQRVDEAVAYLGTVAKTLGGGASEPLEGGGWTLEVVIDVEDKPHPRLVFQAISHFATLHSGKLVIMEVKRRSLPPLLFPIPLPAVKGIEPADKAIKRLRKPWAKASKL